MKNNENNKSHFSTDSDKKKKKHPWDVYVVPVLQFGFGFYG